MDYYDELGLRRAATLKEIRQTYKIMARLVQPDGPAQDQVREMAERQEKTARGTYPATYVELLLAEDRGRAAANFKWTAVDGAKGEVEHGWTTEFGRHLPLGASKLVRRQVR
jgi:hypothetical protein